RFPSTTLFRSYGQPEYAEQGQVDQQHQYYAGIAEAAVEVVLDPVVGAALAVGPQGVLILRLGHVQLGALAQYRAQALLHRAVRIFRGLALGVVLAMDRGPLPGVHAGGQPQPETEE